MKSSDWRSTESTKTGLRGHVDDFALDYVLLNGVKTIYGIHRYLMKKLGIVSDVYFNEKMNFPYKIKVDKCVRSVLF